MLFYLWLSGTTCSSPCCITCSYLGQPAAVHLLVAICITHPVANVAATGTTCSCTCCPKVSQVKIVATLKNLQVNFCLGETEVTARTGKWHQNLSEKMYLGQPAAIHVVLLVAIWDNLQLYMLYYL